MGQTHTRHELETISSPGVFSGAAVNDGKSDALQLEELLGRDKTGECDATILHLKFNNTQKTIFILDELSIEMRIWANSTDYENQS